MNRRELLKAGSLALISSAAAACTETPATPPPDARGEGETGTLSIVFHGPSILTFPGNGASARIDFLAFQDPQCPLPIHFPKLMIEETTTTSVQHPGKTEWGITGFGVTPSVGQGRGRLEMTDYDKLPDPDERPPANWTDWSSLKWVPKLEPAIDRKKLEYYTIATVELAAGRLQGFRPYYCGVADTMLWTWQTPEDWQRLLRSPQEMMKAKRNPMTDQVVYTAPFTGDTAKLRLTPFAFPDSAFDVEFKTTSTPRKVSLRISSESADDAHAGETRPLAVSCGYYFFLPTPPVRAKRLLPYEIGPLSSETVPGRPPCPPQLASHKPAEKRRPMPNCGMIRASVD